MTGKNVLLKEFNEAFMRNDLDFILENLSDDIVWEIVGDKKMNGKEEVRMAMQEMKTIQTLDMQIFHTIIHGNTAAVDGSMKIKKSSGGIESFGFCDVYEFNGFKKPKISRMTSYVLPLQKK